MTVVKPGRAAHLYLDLVALAGSEFDFIGTDGEGVLAVFHELAALVQPVRRPDGELEVAVGELLGPTVFLVTLLMHAIAQLRGLSMEEAVAEVRRQVAVPGAADES